MVKLSSRRRSALDDPEEVLNLAQRWLETAKRQWKWLLLGAAAVSAVLAIWGVHRGMQIAREDRAAAALVQERAKFGPGATNAEAAKALKDLADKYPGTKAAYEAELMRANLLYRLKNYGEAAAAFETLLKGDDPLWNTLVSESLSYCYEGLGEFKKAAALLKSVEEESTGAFRREVAQRLALLYEKVGEPQEAAVYWRQLLDPAPGQGLTAYFREKAAAAEARGEAPKK
jgi:tetratricopeptide (TPR) repeat protein